MRSWLIRVVTALAAVLFGALPLAPVLATVSEGATYTYTYDLHGLYAATPHGTTERGPPATRNNPITYDPNGLRTLGVSARSHTPTTPATYDYDDLARFVRTARGSHGAEGQPRGLNGDLCALLSVRSAANSGATNFVGRKGLTKHFDDGSSASYGGEINIARSTNAPGVVNGRSYSGHAFDQMQGRGVTPSVVDDAIGSGAMSRGADASRIFYSSENNISVVLNSDGRVITVGYGAFKPR